MSVIIEQDQRVKEAQRTRGTVYARGTIGQDDVFLQRIPDAVYQEIVDTFSEQYHFCNGLENGGRMRIANYFVGISAGLVHSFNQFIATIEQEATDDRLPAFQVPNGFAPQKENLLPTEQGGGFSMGSFDMAVTDDGLRNIEPQAVATYPVSAALLNRMLLQHLPDVEQADKAFLFADGPQKDWDDFQQVYQKMLGGEQGERVVLTDRKVQEQKTNFEFYATQKELGLSVDIVDVEDFFEQDRELYYTNSAGQPVRVTRLYNRIILADALFLENYPEGSSWQYCFDKRYEGLQLVNHPIKQFEVSKRLAPYIEHPLNPTSYELAEVASAFRQGILAYDDYVWKHKWGAAGHRLFLSPSEEVLDDLADVLDEYIAQKKVDYTTFITDDGQEKIVELRFMTARHNEQTITVPMARIGHVHRDQAGRKSYKIHFGDNNMAGYGFSPVLIFNE
ncbi:hypothetical protein H206_00079 [Candidatus Electrothrix aarhusensis]|uniref:Uncharacterized protein n=1 Tax=Candidatus Electrothrix aarhusensis TaxID=1859131 RepID=A0A444IYR9_9BACT|nr:hypothetical protein H206_00079 [Candidatus Electrothrix aarhusensis]